MKTVLITGCSSGIGYATALAFANHGFHVIATMRNLEKAALLENKAKEINVKLDIRHLDITSEHSIQSLVKEYKHIAILVNNAGAGFLGSLEQTSLKQAQDIMDVNFFGVWRLTKAVLPNMRTHRSGHVISVSSIGGLVGQPFNDAYCAAKFAVEGMMESLAPVLKRFWIQTTLVEPGPVNSDFVATTLNNSPALSVEIDNDYRTMLDAYIAATKYSFTQFGQAPDKIAEIIVEIAKNPSASFRYQTSEVSKKIASIKLSDTTGNQVIALSGSRLPMVSESGITEVLS